jgi:DNA polymerase-3 subunit beta
MKIQIKKEDMVKGLQSVQNAISQKNTLPILSNLLLETDKDAIKLTATDLDIGIISTIKSIVEEPGAITVPAKKIYDIIKELPNKEDIDIVLKKNNILYIDCGSSHFKIIGLPKEEFPEIPKIKQQDRVMIGKDVLKKMLALTTFAVSKDESRYVLNGILCMVEGDKIEMVATDGRRLAASTQTLPEKNNDETKHLNLLDENILLDEKTHKKPIKSQ